MLFRKIAPPALAVFIACMLLSSAANAELKLSSVFGDHMVVQRDQPIHVWGWTMPGQSVNVTLAGNEASGKADGNGRFDVKLPALSAGGPHELVVSADESITFKDVLVGEVWICSGQSNMAWQVSNSNDQDLEALTAKYSNLRLISVPQVGTQEPQNDFDGKWEKCTPESVKTFSAVGYYFGRQLHQTLDVPVGLIDNAWGGSAAEAWVPRETLQATGNYDELLSKWDDTEKNYDFDQETEKWKARVAKWEENKKGNRPRPPRNPLVGQHRPGNLYNGVLMPVLGYTIRGTIWYQGESNAGRAYQYRDLFPLMINKWRKDWGQGDFPFYWVQLADFRPETEEPAESSWAELREAQTMALELPKTGEAVILNLGEAADIHPKNKQGVAMRLARWALATEYGINVPYRSPTYDKMTVVDNKVAVDFAHVGGGLDTFDVNTPIGFAIAGEDKIFVHATAKIVDKDTIHVWNDAVKNPTAVRYAWADNPVCNVQSREGLPMTPFRTDQWKGVTEGVVK